VGELEDPAMRIARLVSALFGIALVPAATVSAPSSAATPAQVVADAPGYQIVSPSGNIHCGAYVEGPRKGAMRCYLRRTAKVVPRPASAECDWDGGRLFSLWETGVGVRASWCDALPLNKPPIRLAYGRVWHRGPFSCLASQIAILCTNAEGHGLLLSYAQQRAF
jgi:hypothetical protein